MRALNGSNQRIEQPESRTKEPEKETEACSHAAFSSVGLDEPQEVIVIKSAEDSPKSLEFQADTDLCSHLVFFFSKIWKNQISRNCFEEFGGSVCMGTQAIPQVYGL